MKVRHKLFISIASLVVFMGSVFFGLSHGYMENLFRQYAKAAAQSNAEQWANVMASCFEQNGESWVGANPYILAVLQQNQNLLLGTMSVYDAQQHLVLTVGKRDSSGDHQNTVQVPIFLAGQAIGSLTISGRILRGSPVEQNIINSMTIATVWGLIVTSFVALLVGAWLARIIAKPLRSMTSAMHQITAGDLHARIDISSNDEFGDVSRTFNEMTDRLSRTEEARRHLVADVAHELRTPLTIIQGQLELIQQGVKQAEPETLLPIQDEVTRLTRLVQDLHQLTLAEVGKLPLEKSPNEIVGLVERIVEIFQVEAEDREIDLTFESRMREPTMVMLDPNRITQVFVNLLGNALRYTPSHGRVKVFVERTENHIRVNVTDSGPGIAAEHLTHIFDRFYRGEGDRSRESGGTGLGLAIAKEFVEAHHGWIDVDSAVGEGTTFSVCLPADFEL